MKVPFEKFLVDGPTAIGFSDRTFEIIVRLGETFPTANVQRQFIVDAIREKIEREKGSNGDSKV